MFRQKALKIIVVMSLLLSILILPVYAAMPGGVNSVYPLNVNSIKVLVKNDNDEFIEVSVSSTGRDVTDGRVQFTVARTDGKNWNVNEKFFVDVYMSVDADAERYYSADYCVSALYRLTVSGNCIINKAENNYFARADLEDEHIVYDGTYEKEADNVIDVKYPYSNIGDSFRRYYNRFRITFNKTQSYFTLNLLGVKFTSITHEQALREDLITNQNENTDKLIANQDKNTQEIIANEKKLQEQEKAEAHNTGADGVDDITSAIPVRTDGIIDAFTLLTKSMIHNKTDCNLQFPTLKIPKIGNFWEKEIILWQGGTIDFENVITMIPEFLLNLIRALCTIGIVIYCAKEMYSQLGFIFTAKGGGESE